MYIYVYILLLFFFGCLKKEYNEAISVYVVSHFAAVDKDHQLVF
jgi:hypothetical protein